MSTRSLKVFIAGPSPRSLKKITQFNWSGHAYYGTREQLKEMFKRPDAEGAGLYFLLSDMNTEMVSMYVGETENFSKRVQSHNRSKDWWTHFIVFQSEGSSLNKAHIRYLEYVFWRKANESTQIELMNDQAPNEPNLSEEDVADLKIFEANILYTLEAMNLGYFTSSGGRIDRRLPVEAEYSMNVPKTDYKALMQKEGDKYILKAGSHLRIVPRLSFGRSASGYFKRWQEIVNSKNVENVSEDVCRLLEDLEFSSSSAAGSMVKGGATNGAKAWKNTSTGLSIKEELLAEGPDHDEAI